MDGVVLSTCHARGRGQGTLGLAGLHVYSSQQVLGLVTDPVSKNRGRHLSFACGLHTYVYFSLYMNNHNTHIHRKRHTDTCITLLLLHPVCFHGTKHCASSGTSYSASQTNPLHLPSPPSISLNELSITAYISL